MCDIVSHELEELGVGEMQCLFSRLPVCSHCPGVLLSALHQELHVRIKVLGNSCELMSSWSRLDDIMFEPHDVIITVDSTLRDVLLAKRCLELLLETVETRPSRSSPYGLPTASLNNALHVVDVQS